MLFSGPVNAAQEKFENGVFTLKTYQTFSVNTAPDEFKIKTNTGHFGFVSKENYD